MVEALQFLVSYEIQQKNLSVAERHANRLLDSADGREMAKRSLALIQRLKTGQLPNPKSGRSGHRLLEQTTSPSEFVSSTLGIGLPSTGPGVSGSLCEAITLAGCDDPP